MKREDIIEICKKQTTKLISFKKQDNFIEKIRKLYLSLNNNDEENVSIKKLWGWIKNVIKLVSRENKITSKEKVI